jgi:hypothetical protein
MRVFGRSKVEIKNVNSFKAVQQAVDFETLRQAKAYDEGLPVRQETRMWDEKGEKAFCFVFAAAICVYGTKLLGVHRVRLSCTRACRSGRRRACGTRRVRLDCCS